MKRLNFVLLLISFVFSIFAAPSLLAQKERLTTAKMKEILSSKDSYPYLRANAKNLLDKSLTVLIACNKWRKIGNFQIMTKGLKKYETT